MSKAIIDTFQTADLIRYGWLTFEDGLRNFTTVQVLLDPADYEQFQTTMASPDRHPIASMSLLTCAKSVIIPRSADGRVATSGDSEYGAFVSVTSFLSAHVSKSK